MGEKEKYQGRLYSLGNPQQNAYIERYNRTARYGWVSKHLFDTLEEVQDYATEWLWFYNHEGTHTANGGKPPLMSFNLLLLSCIKKERITVLLCQKHQCLLLDPHDLGRRSLQSYQLDE